MNARSLPSNILQTIDDLLEQLKDGTARQNLLPVGPTSEPLQSLLEQCEAICASIEGPEPIRTIHHFACTGGTAFSRMIGAMPNVAIVSEIDPLSTMKAVSGLKKSFAPTDLILGLRQSAHQIDDRVIVSIFLAGLEVAKTELERSGLRVVLRDHAHSQFCIDGIDFDGRPTLAEILQYRFPCRSVVTVRHPLDSFLSLAANRWANFSPFTLSEYARRYSAFLDRHASLPLFRFEDLARDTEATTRAMCDALGLPFNPLGLDLSASIPMTGNSGRVKGRLSVPPRRAVEPHVLEEISASDAYASLVERLGYPRQ